MRARRSQPRRGSARAGFWAYDGRRGHRTLATDKRLFPRGAVVFVDTVLPLPGGGAMPFRRVMFDQDTGGAIRTAGRADIYLGIGHEAERRAGTTRSEGQLYYLFLVGSL